MIEVRRSVTAFAFSGMIFCHHRTSRMMIFLDIYVDKPDTYFGQSHRPDSTVTIMPRLYLTDDI